VAAECVGFGPAYELDIISMRSIIEIARELIGGCRAGKTRVRKIITAAVIILICAAVVAVIGKMFSLSDYWTFITYVIIAVLAIIGEVL